jgi:hypothetical protein
MQPHSRHALMRGLLHRPPDVAASIAAQSPTAARGGRAVLVSGRGSSRLAERGGRHGRLKTSRRKHRNKKLIYQQADGPYEIHDAILEKAKALGLMI